MDRSHRVVVIGVGGIGAAACYWAAREGAPVLGLEQFPLFHARGGSQDHSRIIRLAQHQEPYATLAQASYDTWADLEREAGMRLVVKTGGVVIEAVDERRALDTGTRNIAGYAAMLGAHGVDYELLDAKELATRWPQFELAGDEQAIYQRDSGLVDAAKANAVHVALARAHGAEIRAETPVRAVHPTAGGIEVVTDTEVFLAEKVIVSSGAWTNTVLPDSAAPLPLLVSQEQVTYYATSHLAEFSPERFPVFMWHGRHNFYGFPVYGEVATKLGQHFGGFPVTADTRTFEPDPVRVARQREFLERHVPRFAGPELYTKTCLYTVPPDQGFVLGPLPADPRILVFVGAGHAFKFASLLGRILAQLALTGATEHPVDEFRLDRPALTDPAFVPTYHT